MDALAKINAYEVNTFLHEHGVDTACAQGVFKPVPIFNCAMLPTLEQIVLPTTCAALTLSREALKNADMSSLDYPFSLNECEMLAPLEAGREYALEARFDGAEDRADVEIKIPGGSCVYRLHRHLFSSEPAEKLKTKGKLVCSGTFKTGKDDSIQNFGQSISTCFGKPIGLGSSESHLRAFAGAFSIVDAAIGLGKLSEPGRGVDAEIYAKPQFYLNAERTVNLKKGVRMHLYIDGKERFGKENEAPMGISIVGSNSGGILYHFNADLIFKKK